MLKMITSEVPVGLETYYDATQDGQFRLKVEDAVPLSEHEDVKKKVKEFRDSNTSLLKDKQKFESFAQLMGDGNLTADKVQEKIEKLAESRATALVDNMRATHESKYKELETNYSKASSRLSELVLGSEVSKVATEHGVLGSALEDVMLRAKNAFTVEDGAVKFKEEKLDANGRPYTVQSWMQEQKSKAAHLFVPSQGTGPSRPKGSGTKVSDEKVSGVDRISAAFAQKNNTAKSLN